MAGTKTRANGRLFEIVDGNVRGDSNYEEKQPPKISRYSYRLQGGVDPATLEGE